MRMLLVWIFLPREVKKLLRILPTIKHRLAPSDAVDGADFDTTLDKAAHAAMWLDIEAEARSLILEDRAASVVTLKARQHSAHQLCLYYVAEALRNILLERPDGLLQEPPDRSAALKLSLFAEIIEQLVRENVLTASEGEAILTGCGRA